MLKEYRRVVFHSRLMSVMVHTLLVGSVNLLLGFTLFSDRLQPGALIISVVTGVFIGLMLFEMYKSGVIKSTGT